MFKSIIEYILNNIFKINTETTQNEIKENSTYETLYQQIDNINFDAIFSNKLANYVISDCSIDIEGENERSKMLDMIAQSMWKRAKKITSMSFGYGGVCLVPYVKKGKIFYDIVPQSRITIDKMDGENIVSATILAEKKTIKSATDTKTYLRWTHYEIKDENLSILQQYSDETGKQIPTPDFWKDVQEIRTITNVDRVPFGFIKSPINNRKQDEKYGVPITYGCEETVLEIRETLKQMVREYELKEVFVGVDASMFSGKNKLSDTGLYKKLDTGKDDFFQVYDPQFRDYTNRLQDLYRRLEHQIGTSYGILSDVTSTNATATEIRKSMFDTFTICDDMRTNLEKGLDDFFYSCNVLANTFKLSAQGEYNLTYNWDYSLLQDTETEWQQLVYGQQQGIISKTELRQWLKPEETIEESEEAIKTIEEEAMALQQLLGGGEENPEENPKEQEGNKQVETKE